MDALGQGKTRRELPAAHGMQTLLRLYQYMIEYRGLFGMLIVLLVLAFACGLSIPLIIESAMNAIAFSGGVHVDFRRLMVSVSQFVAVVSLSAVFGFLQERISAKITLNMSRRLRQDAFASLMETSISTFEGMRRGDLMSRMMNDAELAAGAFTESFRSLFSAILMIIGCAIVMFLKCWPLALVSVGSAVISVIAMGVLSKIVLPVYTRQQVALGQLNSHIEESLKAFRTCTSGGRLPESYRRTASLSRQYYERRLAACRLEYLMSPLMVVFGNLNFLATVIFGAREIILGAVTIGAMQAFIMYSRQLMEPLNALGEHLVRVQNALAGAERIFYVIDLVPERLQIEDKATDAEVSEDVAIEFKDVRFGYHQNLPVLRGLNLVVRRGERLALVGRTGEGKTTLMNLLMLFYPKYKGLILFEGVDVRGLDPMELRRQVAVVSQEPQIVEGTVLDNLLYGAPNATQVDAERVIRDLSIEALIDRLPSGVDTEITGIGDSMSQGELQLICLARALLRDCPFLILDEATSSLDPSTEQLVRTGIERAVRGRTSIIIAHRLSSIRDADHIAVMANGVIAEFGTHESLMALNGIYHELYQTQFLGKET